MEESSLKCRVISPTGIESLTFIVPLEFDGKKEKVQVDSEERENLRSILRSSF